MTRLHYVKKARKTNRKKGIKKGMPYYWWQFYRGPKHISTTRPRRSQYMTRSEYLRTMMDLEDQCGDGLGSDYDIVVGLLEDMRDTVDSLKMEIDEKVQNLQEAFPNGCPTLELLEERAEKCQEIYDAIENAISDITEDSTEEEIAEAVDSITWDY